MEGIAMTRDEMVARLMRTAGLTKANVSRFYEGLVEVIKKELASRGEFVLSGLGTLRVVTRKARQGRNPRTGEVIQIPRRKVVRFRAYSALRQLLNPALGRAMPPKTEETLPQTELPGEEQESCGPATE